MCAPIWVQDRDSEESGKEVALMAVVWGGGEYDRRFRIMLNIIGTERRRASKQVVMHFRLQVL